MQKKIPQTVLIWITTPSLYKMVKLQEKEIIKKMGFVSIHPCSTHGKKSKLKKKQKFWLVSLLVCFHKPNYMMLKLSLRNTFQWGSW